jgi:NAD(P)-dependent dehydrogenase (short-subunit alcohol dehydrogenase family)
MALSFANKVILITGAGSGIGRATTMKLSFLNALLTLTDINPTSLLETKSLCSTPDSHYASAFDISSTSSCDEFISAIISKYNRIDNIFNCAGINPTKMARENLSDENWDKLMNTNLKGVFNITRAIIPHLKSGSSFVNVSSTAGLRPSAQTAVYCATKAAIIGGSRKVWRWSWGRGASE